MKANPRGATIGDATVGIDPSGGPIRGEGVRHFRLAHSSVLAAGAGAEPEPEPEPGHVPVGHVPVGHGLVGHGLVVRRATATAVPTGTGIGSAPHRRFSRCRRCSWPSRPKSMAWIFWRSRFA